MRGDFESQVEGERLRLIQGYQRWTTKARMKMGWGLAESLQESLTAG